MRSRVHALVFGVALLAFSCGSTVAQTTEVAGGNISNDSASNASASNASASNNSASNNSASNNSASNDLALSNEPTAPVIRPDADQVIPSVVRIIGAGCRLPALGTGFAVDENLIITNAHLVAGRSEASLGVQNLAGNEFDAVLIGFDPDLDLALLRVDDGSFTPLNLITEVPLVDGVAIGIRTDSEVNVINEIEYTVDAPVIVNWDGVFQDTESRFRGLRMLGDIRQGDSGSPLLINNRDVIGLVQSTTRNQPQGYAVGAADISEFVDSIGPSDEAAAIVADRCA